MRSQSKTVSFDSAAAVIVSTGTVSTALNSQTPLFDPRGYNRVQVSAILGGGRTYSAYADFGDGNWITLGTAKGTAVALVVGPGFVGWSDGNSLPGMFPVQLKLVPSAVDAADSFTVALNLS